MFGSFRVATLVGGLALALAGCDSTSPRSGEVRVLMNMGSVSSPAREASGTRAWEGETRAAPPTLDNVVSIDVAISAVELLPASQDTTSPDGWISLTVNAADQLDLLALPVIEEPGREVARGPVPVGAYRAARLVVSGASITFREPVTIGQQTYPANERIPLTIPGGRLLLPSTDLTMVDGTIERLGVTFDAGASVRTLSVTGANRINLNPVLVARPLGAPVP